MSRTIKLDTVKRHTEGAILIDTVRPTDTIAITSLNRLASPEFIAGNTKCIECNKTVSSHPTDETRPYLYVLCNGTLVETKKNQKPPAKSNGDSKKRKYESPFAFRRLKPASRR